ncbi:MAG TPA: hypothetical protein PLY93_08760, partial [Turneriella sp.]|nr:hypothetical protein [Turneriella sp.]
PLGRRLAIADRMIQEHEEVNLNIYYALLAASSLTNILQQNRRDSEKQLEHKVKGPLSIVQKDIQLTRREYETLLQIFSTQNYFHRDVNDRKGWVKEFQQRKIFPESFTVYKILARADDDEAALQKALFWEIGLRHHLPESIRKSAVERAQIDEKEYNAYTPTKEDTRENKNTSNQRTPSPKDKNRRRRGRRGGNGRNKQKMPPALPPSPVP